MFICLGKHIAFDGSKTEAIIWPNWLETLVGNLFSLLSRGNLEKNRIPEAADETMELVMSLWLNLYLPQSTFGFFE